MSPRNPTDVTPYHRSMPVNVESMLRAHAYMRTGRPSDTWDPDVDDQTFFALLGEMIVVGMRRGNDLGELTLSITNVTVMPGADGPIPPGDHVAITISGHGDWTPEQTWSRETAGAAPFVTPELEDALVASDAIYGYTRQGSPESGGITAMFPAAAPPGD